jgi:putative membrane protein
MSLNLRSVITMAGYTVLLSVPTLLGASSLSKNDAAFLKLAAKASMTEAHLGQMAEAQASRQAVKDFGEQLSKDHTTAYEGLTVLANKTGEAIPKAIGHDQTIAHLTHMKGAGFDHAFLVDEVQSHKAALATFKNEAEKGDSPDVKAWAKSMIPTLEGHLKTAEDLAKTK